MTYIPCMPSGSTTQAIHSERLRTVKRSIESLFTMLSFYSLTNTYQCYLRIVGHHSHSPCTASWLCHYRIGDEIWHP